MSGYEKLDYKKRRKEKFGVITKIRFDDSSDEESRTMVYYHNYRELMKSGKWLDEHSTDPSNKKWEWGTPKDYLGKGTKLLLFDTVDKGITVIADVIPTEAFYDWEVSHKVRNVMKPFPEVLDVPIPPEVIEKAGIDDPRKIGKRPFENITEEQFKSLIENYKAFLSSRS
ncbi:hypothetical protein ApAK_07320 [Thermoplasmatales archaeon AK]|nr:hypothetical protein [Thermoplasmatales archaeon AK]